MTSPKEPPSQSPKSTGSSVPPSGKPSGVFTLFKPGTSSEEIFKGLKAMMEKADREHAASKK